MGNGGAKRLSSIAKDLDSWEKRLSTASTRAADLQSRRDKAGEALKYAKLVPATLESKRASLAHELEKAEAQRRVAGDDLARAEAALRSTTDTERTAERTASEAREVRARDDAKVDAAAQTVEAAVARIAEEQETTPEALLDQLDVNIENMPTAEAVEVDLAKLRRQRDALGAVNLRAEDDAVEVKAELETLTHEKADLEEAITALRGGIASLNREGRDRLLAAFDDVNRNFSALFTHLFGGGGGEFGAGGKR